MGFFSQQGFSPSLIEPYERDLHHPCFAAEYIFVLAAAMVIMHRKPVFLSS
jgi:hypothetical protein